MMISQYLISHGLIHRWIDDDFDYESVLSTMTYNHYLQTITYVSLESLLKTILGGGFKHF